MVEGLSWRKISCKNGYSLLCITAPSLIDKEAIAAQLNSPAPGQEVATIFFTDPVKGDMSGGKPAANPDALCKA